MYNYVQCHCGDVNCFFYYEKEQTYYHVQVNCITVKEKFLQRIKNFFKKQMKIEFDILLTSDDLEDSRIPELLNNIKRDFDIEIVLNDEYFDVESDIILQGSEIHLNKLVWLYYIFGNIIEGNLILESDAKGLVKETLKCFLKL